MIPGKHQIREPSLPYPLCHPDQIVEFIYYGPPHRRQMTVAEDLLKLFDQVEEGVDRNSVEIVYTKKEHMYSSRAGRQFTHVPW